MKKANVTRKELAEAVADKLGYPLSVCGNVVDCFFDTLKGSMLGGTSIKLVHFGTFSVREKNPRKGRNPRTGETITIEERQIVSFRPSKKLRARINEPR
ncbi:integration host factor subunit alpha [Desulfofustis glycolicus]|uniref:Integration host factor subunit alpha n=1 Tax=Desulfofustis glycolicus DSM 9705 TaxID=1121409 RepID=A0A1M5YKY2_9BACT|nr:integration host factor subunit alpha [Desulfofustis glycolicus]MCB2217969.1 integration host factor subunit alpha [Desulfobulbaceae bacterium]SHI12193.1 integration host factor subunit alpha [Desulfofustis glycolicus DSM 9705]